MKFHKKSYKCKIKINKKLGIMEKIKAEAIMFNQKKMGERIKDLRWKKHLTQIGLSKELEKMGFPISNTDISAYEHGKQYIYRLEVFLALCDILECDPQYLTGSSDIVRIPKDLKEIPNMDNITASVLQSLTKSPFFSQLINICSGTEWGFRRRDPSKGYTTPDKLSFFGILYMLFSDLKAFVIGERKKRGLVVYDETDHS